MVGGFWIGAGGEGFGRGQNCDQFGEYGFGFGHSADADVAAGEPAGFGADEAVAEGIEFGDVLFGDGVFPHAMVHGGGENDGAGGGADHQADEIVGQSGGDFGDGVIRRGGDEHQVGALGQGYVLGIGTVGEVEDAGAHGAAGKGLEGERGYEALGIGGHGDGDAGA